jgi:hypothetical protein
LNCPQEEEGGMDAVGAADFREKEVLHMPGFDGTGPMGAGPMTGGGRGFCNSAYTGYYGPGYGRGFGYGRGYGRGRGMRRGFGAGYGSGRGYGRGYGRRDFYPAWGPAYAPAYGRYAMNPQDEAGMLREEAEYIKQELDAFQKRLEELEAKSQQA